MILEPSVAGLHVSANTPLCRLIRTPYGCKLASMSQSRLLRVSSLLMNKLAGSGLVRSRSTAPPPPPSSDLIWLTLASTYCLKCVCWSRDGTGEGVTFLTLAQDIWCFWIGTVQRGFSVRNKVLFLFHPLWRQKAPQILSTDLHRFPFLRPQAKQLDRAAEQDCLLRILPKALSSPTWTQPHLPLLVAYTQSAHSQERGSAGCRWSSCPFSALVCVIAISMSVVFYVFSSSLCSWDLTVYTILYPFMYFFHIFQCNPHHHHKSLQQNAGGLPLLNLYMLLAGIKQRSSLGTEQVSSLGQCEQSVGAHPWSSLPFWQDSFLSHRADGHIILFSQGLHSWESFPCALGAWSGRFVQACAQHSSLSWGWANLFFF